MAAEAKKRKGSRLNNDLKRSSEKFQQHKQAIDDSALLLLEDHGFLEAENEMEATYKVKQSEVKSAVDVSTKQKAFDLKLTEFSPYLFDYSRSGNSLVLAGKKGHLATFEWKSASLKTEINVNETIRSVKWLQSDNSFYAAAQRKNVYIYDNETGAEVHRLHKHIEVSAMDYLPYHFLLVTGSLNGFLRYQDVSTGADIADIPTRMGQICSLAQNPYNAIINTGHANGTVAMWAPSSKEPVAKLQSCRGPVRSIAVDRSGRYLATAGADKSVRLWDVRQLKQLDQTYFTPTPASSLHISDTRLLAMGWGPHVSIYKDVFTSGKKEKPYMTHLIPGEEVAAVKFCPFEDILGVGHSAGFSSLIIPGSGEANYDALEINPYASTSARRETEVRSLLEKLQPDMISLRPEYIGSVDTSAPDYRPGLSEARISKKQEKRQQKMSGIQRTKGKNSAHDEQVRRERAEALMLKEAEKKAKKQEQNSSLPAALQRFG